MKTPTIPRGRYVLQRLAPPSVSAPGFSHPVEPSARMWARYALERLAGASHPPSVSVRRRCDVLRQADQEAERRTMVGCMSGPESPPANTTIDRVRDLITDYARKEPDEHARVFEVLDAISMEDGRASALGAVVSAPRAFDQPPYMVAEGREQELQDRLREAVLAALDPRGRA